ncbi:MAG: phosphorylase kinase alpha/beta subunit [Paraglaciecola sp.]|jgi:phosphorylase kinase alpha/beta subunit
MDEIQLSTKLNAYFTQIKSVIIDKQHPISGLLPASTAITSHGNYTDAWVRDNVYSIMAVWGLALAYRKLDNDKGRGYELEQRTVKLMRALLCSMMAQADKVEAFKHSRDPIDALHAKYATETGNIVVGDDEWGHLQIDATSVFLLTLAQMISSGLKIIWTAEEVCFVQNLVYYIEQAYHTPDYGIWERGAKSNSGNVELNASSLGMAKAALEALSGFNLFGAKGAQSSVIHVAPDSIAQSNITLCALLPRESNTKEIDAALLSIIGFPAFAVSDNSLSERVRSDIISKLEGNFGLKRFLRDGHQTAAEDEARLHYEAEELKRFEHIESEWPLFYAYLYLDAIFRDDKEQIVHYRQRLDSVTVEKDGFKMLPELYWVPSYKVELEQQTPNSQAREPNENVPLVWAQSLYLLGLMLEDDLLRTGDLDPLGRRHRKQSMRPVVQLIFLAEDEELQQELAAQGVATETLSDISPVLVYRPQDIAGVHAQVGRVDSLGLTGRTTKVLRSLTTSRIYLLGQQRAVCLSPCFMPQEFFLSYDINLLVRRFKSELSYLHRNWTEVGRPIVTVLLTRNLLDDERLSFYRLMEEIASGNVDEIPVKNGRMAELSPTAAFERIDELNDFQLPVDPLENLISQPTLLTLAGKHLPLSTEQELDIDQETQVDVLLVKFSVSDNLYQQISLLAALARKLGIDASITLWDRQYSPKQLIEEVYTQAGRLRLWSVLRHAAGLLEKVDGDLNQAVSDILVAQKMIQVGRSYNDESIISRPLQENDLMTKIRIFCRDDLRDQILTQEILLYIGQLIKARPKLFSTLLTIRISHLIILLTSEIVRAKKITPDEAYEQLLHLAPSAIQSRLEAVLEEYQALSDLPQKLEQLNAQANSKELDWRLDLDLELLKTPHEGWLVWRQHQGIIDRRSETFNSQVWLILQHTTGLVIGNKLDKRNRINSSHVLSDMTQGEKSFVLLIEHLLNNIHAAEYRQLTVETLSVLASFFLQNPSIKIDEAISIDATIGHAVHLAYIERYPRRTIQYDSYKSDAWETFYTRSPEQTSGFLIAALRSLLTLRKSQDEIETLQVTATIRQ